jgi:hypothetical protein
MSSSSAFGVAAPRELAAIRLTSPAARICSIERRNLAATSPVSCAPLNCSQALRRSPKLGIGTSTSSAVRSLSASASPRVRPSTTVRSRRSSIALRSRRRSGGLRSSSPSRHSSRSSSAAASVASAITSGRSRSCTSTSSSGARAAAATIVAASGPQTTSGRRVSAASRRVTSAIVSSRPDATGWAGTRRRGTGAPASPKPLSVPSRNAARRSETLTGRSASGVGPSGRSRRRAPLAGSGAPGAKHTSTSGRSTPSPASRSATSRGLASRRVTSSCR